MTGTNYMGGARSAAQRRLKDTTTRTQKDHFSRQRISTAILSKHLRHPNTRSNATPSTSSLDLGLSLSHASHYNEIQVTSANTRAPTRCYIPSPSARSSPPLMVERAVSKVLNALDEAEPVYIQRNIDKLLKADDLLGLSQTRRDTRSVLNKRRAEDDDAFVKKQRTGWDEQRTINRSFTTDDDQRSLESCKEDDRFAYGPAPYQPSLSTSYDCGPTRSPLRKSFLNRNRNVTNSPTLTQYPGSRECSPPPLDEYDAFVEEQVVGWAEHPGINDEDVPVDDNKYPFISHQTVTLPAYALQTPQPSNRLIHDDTDSIQDTSIWSPHPADMNTDEFLAVLDEEEDGLYTDYSSSLFGQQPSTAIGLRAPRPSGARARTPQFSPCYGMKMSPVTSDTWRRAGVVLGFEEDSSIAEESSTKRDCLLRLESQESHDGSTLVDNPVPALVASPSTKRTPSYRGSSLQDNGSHTHDTVPSHVIHVSPNLANSVKPTSRPRADDENDDDILSFSTCSPSHSPIQTPSGSPTGLSGPSDPARTHISTGAASSSSARSSSTKIGLAALGLRVLGACKKLNQGPRPGRGKILEAPVPGLSVIYPTEEPASLGSASLSSYQPEGQAPIENTTSATPASHDYQVDASTDVNSIISAVAVTSTRVDVSKPVSYEPDGIAPTRRLKPIDNLSSRTKAEMALLESAVDDYSVLDDKIGGVVPEGCGAIPRFGCEDSVAIAPSSGEDQSKAGLQGVIQAPLSLFSGLDEDEEDGYDE